LAPCPAAAVIDQLADRAPGLPRALREADPDYVLLDGTYSPRRAPVERGVACPVWAPPRERPARRLKT
jgi:hypothetical protein